MADNVTIKDASAASVVMRAKDNGGVFSPVHLLYGPDYNTLFPAAAALSDSIANPTVPPIGACAMLYDPASGTWRRETCNHEGTLLASAARTAETGSGNQSNYGCTGVICILNVTVASGTGGLIVRICATDPISGNPVVLNVDVAAITTTGRYGFELGSGASTTAPGGSGFLHQRTAGKLPSTWQARVTHGDGSSYTYSLSYMLIR